MEKKPFSNWITLDLEADTKPLVPWGMGFRLGMFAKGAGQVGEWRRISPIEVGVFLPAYGHFCSGVFDCELKNGL